MRLSCVAHDLNLVVSNGLNLWKCSRTVDIDSNIEQSNEDIEILDDFDEDDELFDDNEDSDVEVEAQVEEDVSGDENSDEEDDEYYDDEEHNNDYNEFQSEEILEVNQESLSKILKNVRNLVNKVRKCKNILNHVRAKIPEIEHEMKGEMVIDFHVRWNTTYIMLDRFLTFKRIITEITSAPDLIEGFTRSQKRQLMQLKPSETSWVIIESLRNVLQRFFIATKILSGQKYFIDK